MRRWIDVEVARRYVDTVAALVDVVPDSWIVAVRQFGAVAAGGVQALVEAMRKGAR